MDEKIEKMKDQIANYDPEYYSSKCTLASLHRQLYRLEEKRDKAKRRRCKRIADAAAERLKYYRSLYDHNDNRTHTDEGIPYYDQYGNPNI
jgi:hypothetical protein